MADKRCPHGWVVVSQCPDCKKITGLQSEIDKLAAENKVLRDALNNCEDALMNSQALIGSHRVGFEKTCFEANDLALRIISAALKGEKHEPLC
jgi:hypothetical protein